MSGQRDALLRAFIESDASPDGKWWIDVPVGLSLGDENEYATIDAVCLTTRNWELPESYPDFTGVPYVVHYGDKYAGVSKVDAFDTLRTRDVFVDERAVIVAVEPGVSSIGLVGELLAHRTLLEADWDWDVDELILVSDEDNEHVNFVCRELSIRAVRVRETTDDSTEV